MSNPYVPLLFLLAIGGGFAVFSVVRRGDPGPKRYNRAKLDAYECGIEPTPQAVGRRPRADQVLPDRDALHHLRHRDRSSSTRSPWPSTSSASSRSSRWCCSSSPSSSPTHTCGAAAGSSGTDEDWDNHMGIEEKLPAGFLLTTVEQVAGYMRKSSVWPATFGLACCAIEMMAVGTPDYDIARFGMERFSATPRQADLMIVAGRVSQKMAPVVRQVYDQMPEPKWVISMGVCASSGGMFNNYAIVQGVDHIIPVDIYLPGCPPRPEMLLNAILELHDQIQNSQARRQPGQQPRRRGGRAGRDADVADDALLKRPTQTARRRRACSHEHGETPTTRAPRHAAPPRTSRSRPRPHEHRAAQQRTPAEPEVVGVRHGMFGADGTGDTSGYGGLVSPILLPGAAGGPTAATSTRSPTGSSAPSSAAPPPTPRPSSGSSSTAAR